MSPQQRVASRIEPRETVGWRGQARALPATVRLLLVNQFGVTFGFYLVVPFLAVHLRDNLMLATATIGAVIGARSLFQQGFTVLGGTVGSPAPNRQPCATCARSLISTSGSTHSGTIRD